MSDTPRTDALVYSDNNCVEGWHLFRDLCRQLERELAAAKATERERCAAMAENFEHEQRTRGDYMYAQGWDDCLDHVSQAISALKDE